MFNLFKKESGIDSQLIGIIQDSNTMLVDVREPYEYDEGSAAGAVNIPVSDVLRRIPEFQNKGAIVVFCRSGNRSGIAKKLLKSKGIENVHNGGSVTNVIKMLSATVIQ